MKLKYSRPFLPNLHVLMGMKALKPLLSCNGVYCKFH